MNNKSVLIGAVIAAGIFSGINNTLTTQAVMMVSAVDAGLDEGGHPANENDDPANVAGEIADEFGGAGGAIDSAEAQPAHRG